MRLEHTAYGTASPYRTADGSEIRELMHPSQHAVRRQSLAEAVIAPGAATLLHAHRRSEEVYHVVAGTGRMTLGGAVFQVGRGDTVVIRPGIAHRVENSGRGELRILCACTPAYSHKDTIVLQAG
jgi:mannose-6-phosphate isomerase-like protein (cupin superfamily)